MQDKKIAYVSSYKPTSSMGEREPILLNVLQQLTEVVPIFSEDISFERIKQTLPAGSYIIWRVLSESTSRNTADIKKQLEDSGYFLINKASNAIPSKDKFETFRALSAAGIPTISTREISEGSLIPKNHIVKPRFGMKGDSILFGEIDIEAIPDEPTEKVPNEPISREWILQPYIPDSKNWWRVLIVNQQIISAYRRIPSSNSVISNVSKGATRRFDSPDKKVMNLALEVASLSGLDICGIDITSYPYMVVEINAIPAIPFEVSEEAGIALFNIINGATQR